MPPVNAINPASELAMNLVFGIPATLISGVTIYQAHKFFKLWKLTNADASDDPDIELETQAVSGAPHHGGNFSGPGERPAHTNEAPAVEAARGRDHSRRRNINIAENGGRA